MPFSANTVPGASVHTENIWSRLWTAIRGKTDPTPKTPVVATDGYEPVSRVADSQNPQAMIAAGAAGGPVKLAVANKHQALARVIEHLSEFGPMAGYVRGKTPTELDESVFMKYFHDLPDKFIVILQDPPAVVSCGLELIIDKKSGDFDSIYSLDLFSRHIGYNRAPV